MKANSNIKLDHERIPYSILSQVFCDKLFLDQAIYKIRTGQECLLPQNTFNGFLTFSFLTAYLWNRYWHYLGQIEQ